MTDPTLPVPNIPLLRKAVEWAEAEAAKTDGTCMWNQALFMEPTDCGTAYCIAGYALSVQPDFSLLEGVFPSLQGKHVGWSTGARKVLGLTHGESDDLFDADNTITDVRRVAEKIAARAGERL